MVDNIFIDLDLPGWINSRDIISICKYIKQYKPQNILEVGPFGGRLTYSICKTFPDTPITVIDAFLYRNTDMLCKNNNLHLSYGEKFNRDYISYDWFKNIHNYNNLNIIENNFLNYKDKQDLLIFSITPDELPPSFNNHKNFLNYTPNLEKLLDHALSISNVVIGNLDSLGSLEAKSGWRKNLLSRFNLKIFDHCYEVVDKKSLIISLNNK